MTRLSRFLAVALLVALGSTTGGAAQEDAKAYNLAVIYRLPDDPNVARHASLFESNSINMRASVEAECSNAADDDAKKSCRRDAEISFRKRMAANEEVGFWLGYYDLAHWHLMLPLTWQEATDPHLDLEFNKTSASEFAEIGVRASVDGGGAGCTFHGPNSSAVHFGEEQELCEALLVSTESKGWEAALLSASRRGDIRVVEGGTRRSREEKGRPHWGNWLPVNNELDHQGQTALMAAVQGGQNDLVKFLVEHDARVGKRDRRGWTALTYAAHYNEGALDYFAAHGLGLCCAAHDGDVSTLVAAVNHGADVNVRDENKGGFEGGVPLECGAEEGQTEAVAWLYTHGAKLTDRALIYAAWGGHTDTVAWLVSHGVSVEARDTSWRSTALIAAAGGGHADIVAWLVAHGANIQDRDRFGRTALIAAAGWDGNVETVAWLVDHGADVEDRDNGGKTTLLTAAESGNSAIVAWLVAHGANIQDRSNDGTTALIYAAGDLGNFETVAWLVGHGANVEDRDDSGYTALMKAAGPDKKNKRDVVAWLVAHGASVHDRAKDGTTALLEAAKGDRWGGGGVEAVAFLVGHGANLEDRDNGGKTALLIAAECGQTDIVAWLVAHGANIQDRAKDGTTPLMHAATALFGGKTLAWLVDHGASVEDRDDNASTALMRAAETGSRDNVAWLLRHGAKPEDRDKLGRTALIRAAAYSEKKNLPFMAEDLRDTADWLIYYGGNPFARDNAGETALDAAVRNGNSIMADFLRAAMRQASSDRGSQ